MGGSSREKVYSYAGHTAEPTRALGPPSRAGDGSQVTALERSGVGDMRMRDSEASEHRSQMADDITQQYATGATDPAIQSPALTVLRITSFEVIAGYSSYIVSAGYSSLLSLSEFHSVSVVITS